MTHFKHLLLLLASLRYQLFSWRSIEWWEQFRYLANDWDIIGFSFSYLYSVIKDGFRFCTSSRIHMYICFCRNHIEIELFPSCLRPSLVHITFRIQGTGKCKLSLLSVEYLNIVMSAMTHIRTWFQPYLTSTVWIRVGKMWTWETGPLNWSRSISVDSIAGKC